LKGVQLSVALCGGLALGITDGGVDQPDVEGRGPASSSGAYPTTRLRKGLVLMRDGHDLADEGVGFGVPVLKQGARTVFPGAVRLARRACGGRTWQVTATYQMNLVERLAEAAGPREGREGAGGGTGAGRGSGAGDRRPAGGPTTRSFYAVRDSLAALHRAVPPLRPSLTAVSNAVRRRLKWVTTFEEIESLAAVAVTFSVHREGGGLGARRRCVAVAVQLDDVPWQGVSEVVVMNEQGAHFDSYADSDGSRLSGARIGTWNEVRARGATLRSASHGVAFSVEQAAGARLYRGRELVGDRLAWAGFGYALRPAPSSFAYGVSIERAP
jgi:hypothetical protein